MAISERMRNQLIKLGCGKDRVHVHHVGVDCSKFRFSPRRKNDNEKVRIVTVARLVEKKGVEYGIRAISRLASARADIEYCVIGDGPLKSRLEQLIANTRGPDTVKLLGWRHQDDVIEAMSQAHILLAPSVTAAGGSQEGVPVAIMEAMALGLPVVSTLHSGIPELVEDGVSGFLVPERDSEALADRLAFLMDHPEVWSKMGAAGRAQVENHYNVATLNSELVRLYSELLAGSVS